MISIRMAWGIAQISAISAISAGPLIIKMIRIIGTAVQADKISVYSVLSVWHNPCDIIRVKQPLFRLEVAPT